MDNFTHTLTGVMLARAGLNRWERRAAWLLALASNAPDLDMVSYLGGNLAGLEAHRAWTHAIAFSPLMAILPALAVRLFTRGPFHWARAWAVSLIGVLGHLAFDFTNSYGVRLGLPFTDRWFHLDALWVADPYILGVLGMAVLAPALGRLVGSEIGARSKAGPGWAVLALAFICGWIGLRVTMQQRAAALIEARLFQGETPRRVAAWPTPFSPVVWAGYAECDSFQALADINTLGEFDPSAARIVYRPESSAALEAARRTPEMARFLRFARYPLTRVLPLADDEGARRIEVSDARFERPPGMRFLLIVDVDGALRSRDAGHKLAR